MNHALICSTLLADNRWKLACFCGATFVSKDHGKAQNDWNKHVQRVNDEAYAAT